jgi:aromatic-L-amino-acid/L-tryptophan decarboxylase
VRERNHKPVEHERQRPRLAVTIGDPAGIGPEVVLKALSAPGRARAPIVLYGSLDALNERARLFDLPTPEKLGIPVVDPTPGITVPLGRSTADGGRAAAEAVLRAVRDAQAGRFDALVTAPLNKESLAAAGYRWPGHTEMLAEAAGVSDVAMMFVGGGLRVALLTIHRSLRSVPDAITSAEVERVVRLVHRELPRFGAAARRIALCGINPHAGEGGLFGREEDEILRPALERLRGEGLEVSGPFPADSLFVRAARGEFDAVVAGYHDQGLIPVKLVAFGRSVNVTLGLPFVRTSVDHGTGFDIVTRGIADEGSLLEALRVAVSLASWKGERTEESGYPLEPDRHEFDALTATSVAFVRDQLATLADQPSFDLDDAATLAASFREPAPEQGRPLEQILDRLGPAVGKSFNTAGPGYLAFIPGGGIYSAALADFIACAVNRYVGVTTAAPALAQIEETAVGWLGSLMGYPRSARGILTSGGSLSNQIALVTARHVRLGEDFQRATIYISEETHHCFAKAARLSGFPSDAVRVLPVDSRFRLVPATLERAIEEDRASGRRPFLVVASVGTTNTGAVDPLPEILDLASRHGLWVHADAAYGGFFRLAPEGEALMPAIERCDSITLDPHKGLFLPYGTGCLLVKDGDLLRQAHQLTASYLQDVVRAEAPSFAELSPELSRDFRGLRLWLPIQLHGLAAFRDQLQEKLELAREAFAALSDDEEFEIVDEPQLSVVAFRLKGQDADARGAELLRRVNARRRVFLSSTRLQGRFTLRLCVLSFRTHGRHVRDAVTALREEARNLR